MAGPTPDEAMLRGERPAGDADDLTARLEQATREADMVTPDQNEAFGDRLVNGAVEIAGVAVLVTVVALVFGNALSRYLVGATFVWADELIISLIPWLAMCGMFLSVRRRQIIRIDFFTEKLSPPVGRALRVFADLFSAAAFGYLALISFEMVSLFGGDRLIYLRLETGWFTSAMVIGAALAALAFAADIVRELRRGTRAEP